MKYKYITGNNLEDKQTYMYSEYGGEDFLTAYRLSRKECIDDLGENDTKWKLMDMLLRLPQIMSNDSLKYSLSKLVQSFEVRKRIYEQTDTLWKPLNKDVGYTLLENYILFGEILIQAYYITKNLKYFNCLLKLDDTLISVQDKMDVAQKKWLSVILEKELSIYEELRSVRGENNDT